MRLRHYFRRNGLIWRESWTVYHPKAVHRHLIPKDRVQIAHSPHLTFYQAHVNPSKAQQTFVRAGTAFVALGVSAAVYQFLTNLHTVPITGRTQVVAVSSEFEIELGEQASTEAIEGKKIITKGPRLRMCHDIASRLVTVSEHLFAPNYEWKIWLVDDPTIANATCFPGGKIVVYTGIMDKIDAAIEKKLCHHQHDALAVVLSHEIAHALARHSAERFSYLPVDYLLGILSYDNPILQVLYQLVGTLPFSRKQETEADHIGIMLMSSACYDPKEASRLWHAFRVMSNNSTSRNSDETKEDEDDHDEIEIDFFSTHPSNLKRELQLKELETKALEMQSSQATWCRLLKEKVQQIMKEESLLKNRIKKMQIFPRRRYSNATMHEIENAQILKSIEEENSFKKNP